MTKAFILNEIRRRAAENDGAAPGMARFAALTGIKYSDWMGRFWVRWNDAIAEAGLQPNQMIGPYDLQDLFKHLIVFIRKVHRFPTFVELRFEARNSPGAPDSTTFQARFGTKAKMAQALIDYCGDDPDLAPVVDISRQAINLHPTEESDSEGMADEAFGYVYLIKAGKHYKIGKANSVKQRFGQLRIQLPDRAELVHQITTDDPLGIEAYWHGRFREKRSNGEWFSLTGQDVRAFKRRKFM